MDKRVSEIRQQLTVTPERNRAYSILQEKRADAHLLEKTETSSVRSLSCQMRLCQIEQEPCGKTTLDQTPRPFLPFHPWI